MKSKTIKSLLILTALNCYGDTQLPPIPHIPRLTNIVEGLTNQIVAPKLLFDYSNVPDQIEVVTNWTDFPPKQLTTIVNHPLTVNTGFEYGLIVTNHFIEIMHHAKQKHIILSSETNNLIILERSFTFERVYNVPAWIIQNSR